MQLPVCCNPNITKWPNIGTVFWATVSKASRKCVYQAAAQAHKLKNQWSWEHDKGFVILKTALTSFLVLKGPKYDGSSFVITTDGCKDGFVGILSHVKSKYGTLEQDLSLGFLVLSFKLVSPGVR